MGGGDSQTSPFTSVTHSDLERLPEEEIEELREQLQTTLDEHESVPGVTSLETSESEIPQRLDDGEDRSRLASAVRDAAGASGMPSGGIAAGDGEPGATAPPSGDPFDNDLSEMLAELEESLDHSPISDIIPDEPSEAESDAGPAGLDGPALDTSELSIDPPDLSDADSRADLAGALFGSERSVLPANRDGDGRANLDVVVEQDGDQTVGTWHSFEMPADDDKRTDLALTGKEQGRTASHMERVDLDDVEGLDGDYDTEQAFVTHYDDRYPDKEHERPPREVHAGHEIGASTFAQQLGANVPRHAYDPDQNIVAAEAFPGDAVKNASSSAVREISAENMRDTLAVQIIAGNTDTHAGNLFVGDDGEVACIDLDIAGKSFSDMDHLARELDMRGARNAARNGGPDVEGEAVIERAQEIAVSLHNDGRVDEVVEATKQAEAATTGRTDVGEAVRNNIDLLVRTARENDGGV
jgi:hypothetical protein